MSDQDRPRSSLVLADRHSAQGFAGSRDVPRLVLWRVERQCSDVSHCGGKEPARCLLSMSVHGDTSFRLICVVNRLNEKEERKVRRRELVHMRFANREELELLGQREKPSGEEDK